MPKISILAPAEWSHGRRSPCCKVRTEASLDLIEILLIILHHVEVLTSIWKVDCMDLRSL